MSLTRACARERAEERTNYVGLGWVMLGYVGLGYVGLCWVELC